MQTLLKVKFYKNKQTNKTVQTFPRAKQEKVCFPSLLKEHSHFCDLKHLDRHSLMSFAVNSHLTKLNMFTIAI